MYQYRIRPTLVPLEGMPAPGDSIPVLPVCLWIMKKEKFWRIHSESRQEGGPSRKLSLLFRVFSS